MGTLAKGFGEKGCARLRTRGMSVDTEHPRGVESALHSWRELSSADGSTNGGGLLRGDSNGSNSDGGWGAEGLTRGPGASARQLCPRPEVKFGAGNTTAQHRGDGWGLMAPGPGTELAGGRHLWSR